MNVGLVSDSIGSLVVPVMGIIAATIVLGELLVRTNAFPCRKPNPAGK
jgi:hypothetical protein